MKTTRCLLFSATLLCGALTGYSQQSSDPTKIAGHFEIDTTIGSVMRHVNVNFELSPVPFGSVARILLNTSQPRLLNVDIVNGAGAVVATWTPSAVSHQYSHDFNISALPAGAYQVHIRKYNTPAILHSINFTK